MEQAIATEIDERPTGDADTDRLLERSATRRHSTRSRFAQLRAGTLPSAEQGPGDDGTAGALDAHPRA